MTVIVAVGDGDNNGQTSIFEGGLVCRSTPQRPQPSDAAACNTLTPRAPARDSIGTVFGAITLSLGFAQLIAPPIGGWLADRSGSFSATYVAAAALGIAGDVFAVALPATGRSNHFGDRSLPGI